MKPLSIHDLEIGMKAEFSKQISEKDITTFAEITGDFNPIHFDESYAKTTRFRKPIAHGVITAGLISAVIGTKLPGPGAIYIKQSLHFLKPVYPGDNLTAYVEVQEVDIKKNRVNLKTGCINQNFETVAEGESILLPHIN